jgi:SAM-dependent methyltransferase
MKTKEIQGKLWSVAPQYWSRHFEPYFMPVYKKVLQQVPLNDDILLLDAGCGSGLFTHLAVSSGAQAIGVDAAPGLLKVARERNPQVNFLEEDLESLPFASETFDVVTGFNSFQYAGDFQQALTEAKRVLKKGGKLVLCIWDKPEQSEATNILKAIGTLLPPPPPGTPGPFALSEDGKIESVLSSIGMKLESRAKVSAPFLYHSLNDAVKSFMGTGPAAAALNKNDERTVRETIARAMPPYRLTEDLFHLQNSFLVFIAEKP